MAFKFTNRRAQRLARRSARRLLYALDVFLPRIAEERISGIHIRIYTCDECSCEITDLECRVPGQIDGIIPEMIPFHLTKGHISGCEKLVES